MPDVILDTAVAAAVGRGHNTEIRDWLVRRRKAGHRNWLYVAQQSELLRLLVLAADKENTTNPGAAARDQLASLQQSCLWLAALAEDGDTLSDPDPVAAGLTRAASRVGNDTRIVTDNPSHLERGLPFISLDSAVAEALAACPISLVDLRAQQDRLRAGLERSLHRVLHHGKFIQGPEIHALEAALAEYVGVEHCIGVSSGTDALLISLMALEIGPGDEVVTTPFSFIATAEMIALVGATAVFADVDPRTGNLDAARLEPAITRRTRAILPVSLYGQCADMTQIKQVAEKHQLPVIEDAAQSFGALHRGMKSCALSTIGCTSFFPAKPLGAYGDAGAIFTSDADLARIMRELLNHGQDGHYHHVRLGVNGRMDSMQAAVLREKLSVLDDELTQRQFLADRYSELLQELTGRAGLSLPFVLAENRSAWAQYTIQINHRDRLRQRLLEAGIPSAVHYPMVLFRQPAFQQSVSNCPHSVSLATKVMSLPLHPYLAATTQHTVVEHLKRVLG
jgi:UDP-2-acetamido-2-deoxy-ribo-hexuluronate aminotransferase